MHLTERDFNEPRHQGNKPWRTIAHPAPRVRVTIQHDGNPMDPFEMDDGMWPMLVKQGERRGERWSSVTVKVEISKELPNSMNKSMQQWFTPEGLIHNQHDIAKILGVGPGYMLDTFGRKHTTDHNEVWAMMDEHELDEDDFDRRAELYELAGVICEVAQVSGRSQGDWAEVLMIAPAETIVLLRGEADEVTVREDMERQAQLYEDWAYGNCYGYVVEILPEAVGDPEDVIEEDWAEPTDTPEWSCWGYIGDWGTSDILDQINEVLRYEPVRTMIEQYQTLCEKGMHSWVDDPTITDPDHTCTRCGDLYGKPEGVSDYLTGAEA